MLDDHLWADSITVLSYGILIRVQVTDASVLPLVKEALPPYWEISDSLAPDLVYSLTTRDTESGANQSRLYSAFLGCSRITQHWDIAVVLRAMESSLHLEVADRARDRVFVHAGVVGLRGRAIVLPGRSMAGKTTLVSRLIEAGCVYYSDEFAVLDADGLVHPYARPLSVRETPGALPRLMSPDLFGGETGLEPIPAGLVLICKYVPGVSFRPRHLSRGRSVLELIDNTIPIRRDPTRALSALVELSASATCWKGRRGDSAQVVRFIESAAVNW